MVMLRANCTAIKRFHALRKIKYDPALSAAALHGINKNEEAAKHPTKHVCTALHMLDMSAMDRGGIIGSDIAT
jgi:hypothetical protein